MNKIAVDIVKAFLNENKRELFTTKTFSVGGNSFEVKIKTELTIDEKAMFISRVMKNCFDAAGEYHPEYFSPMIRATILQMCTNMPVIPLQEENDKKLMDLDSMNALYVAMDLDGFENEAYQAMLQEICALCKIALEAHLNHTSSADAEVTHALAGAILGIRNIAEAVREKINMIDMSELMQYAKDIAEAVKEANEEGVLGELL